MSDEQGNLFGTTAAGGVPGCSSPIDAPGCGVVFEVSPPASGQGPWTETVLYAFADGADGDGPLAGLVRDPAGNLFGTTEIGGAGPGGCSSGCGIVFEISPPSGGAGPWTETVLHKFGGSPVDGTNPSAGLVRDTQGNLFGTTPGGGAHGLGTVYELSPQNGGGWAETIVHDFRAADGAGPVAGLLLNADGTLFGTTDEGSDGGRICGILRNCGTIFQLSPPPGGQKKWAFSVLFRFPGNGKDGLYPQSALVQDAQGRLIGTTDNFGRSRGQQGNGTVFRLSPPGTPGGNWALATLLAFTTDGSYPAAPVLQGDDGTLYGTTMQAGTGSPGGNGLVYALNAPAKGGKVWTETPLYVFSHPKDGAMPEAGLIADAQGRLYGTTSSGGDAHCRGPNCGTVYRVTPAK